MSEKKEHTFHLSVAVKTKEARAKVKFWIKKGIYRGLDSEPNYIATPENVSIKLSYSSRFLTRLLDGWSIVKKGDSILWIETQDPLDEIEMNDFERYRKLTGNFCDYYTVLPRKYEDSNRDHVIPANEMTADMYSVYGEIKGGESIWLGDFDTSLPAKSFVDYSIKNKKLVVLDTVPSKEEFLGTVKDKLLELEAFDEKVLGEYRLSHIDFLSDEICDEEINSLGRTWKDLLPNMERAAFYDAVLEHTGNNYPELTFAKVFRWATVFINKNYVTD